jgi:hypothetical protein
VLCRRPKEFKDKIVAKTDNCIWKYKGDMTGQIQRVSDKAADVIPGSKVVLVCAPSHVALDILNSIKDHLEPDCYVGCIYGGGCFDLQAIHALGARVGDTGITIFGMQFVPFLCKATKYGQEAEIYGPKNYLCATAFPIHQ